MPRLDYLLKIPSFLSTPALCTRTTAILLCLSALSSCGLFDGDDQVVVHVGRLTITRQEFEERIDELSRASPERAPSLEKDLATREQVLDAMIDEKLLVLMAKQRGVPKLAGFKRELDKKHDEILVKYFLKEIVDKQLSPPASAAVSADAELRRRELVKEIVERARREVEIRKGSSKL